MINILTVTLAFALTACQANHDLGFDGNGRKPFRFQQSELEQKRMELHAKPRLQLTVNGHALGEIDRIEVDDVFYVPVVEILQHLDLHVEERKTLLRAGFSDAFIELQKDDSKLATLDGETARLPFPLKLVEGRWWIAVPNLKVVLGQNAQAWTNEGVLHITNQQDVLAYGFTEENSLEQIQIDRTEGTDKPFQSLETINNGDIRVLLQEAKNQVGKPYKFDAPVGQQKAFDSSLLVQYVYGQQGIELPRLARVQAYYGQAISPADLQPGDMMFFAWPGSFKANPMVSHVGLYLGNGYMIHASSKPEKKVQIEDLAHPESIYRELYLGAKRVIQ